jgi:hypothetical protein
MRKLNAKSWIELKQKQDTKMKVECVMWNERIHGLAINYNFASMPEQEQIRTLDVEGMESSSKIDLKVVSWWMLTNLKHQ